MTPFESTARTASLLLSLLGALVPRSASAQVPLCLSVEAPPAQRESFEKLVRAEVARHPTHTLVEADCRATLEVELIEVARALVLTARAGREVPVRYSVSDPRDLAERLGTAISLVLGNEPVYLSEDITHYNAFQRAAHSILRRGQNSYRLALFEVVGRSGEGAAFASGGAIEFARGSGHWQVFARIYCAGMAGDPVGRAMRLRLAAGGDVGLIFEFSALSDATFYLGAGLGLAYLRYDGLTDPGDPQTLDHRNDLGLAFHLRAGARLLRLNDFTLDLFAIGYLPAFGADPDTSLSRFYPLLGQAGVAVGF